MTRNERDPERHSIRTCGVGSSVCIVRCVRCLHAAASRLEHQRSVPSGPARHSTKLRHLVRTRFGSRIATLQAFAPVRTRCEYAVIDIRACQTMRTSARRRKVLTEVKALRPRSLRVLLMPALVPSRPSRCGDAHACRLNVRVQASGGESVMAWSAVTALIPDLRSLS